MNVLNVEVSYFRNINDTANPVTVILYTYLQSNKHRAAIERLRATDNQKERARLKDLLPGITPSGVFSYRDEKHLVKHSGGIAGDIDFKDNPYNPETIKKQVAKIRNVAYCGLSASGTGLWFYVVIAYPEFHKEHYESLITDFARLGIKLDTKPKNPASFRYYSYDPNAYFNLEAKPYTKLQTRQPDTYKPDSSRAQDAGSDGEKVEAVVRQIEGRRLDITGNYELWFALLSSLATLGEAGRDYAHRISQFYQTTKHSYSSRKTDRQFTHCLRMKNNRFTLGTFFKVAADNGITYREHFAQEARQTRPAPPRMPASTAPAQIPAPRVEPATEPPSAPRNTQPTAPALPPGYERRTYTDSTTGEPIEVLLNADGYPAEWDLEEPQREALVKAILINPIVTDTIARMELTYLGAGPITENGNLTIQKKE